MFISGHAWLSDFQLGQSKGSRAYDIPLRVWSPWQYSKLASLLIVCNWPNQFDEPDLST